ncbi:MAG: phosphomannomutase/phosphoglucomutase [Gammaproteobacteria bacterium]|jgi:phosphomannomutase / phosphoglucomutase|nr:phosphomannomutase/phosphoglucomutase [Gammaproteobacteria bacterium]MBT7603650.1 phosphomannomutase/phosphoglucomutase [Gammaproteobacteria bacterium]
MNISKDIFKAYDVRGIYDSQLTLDSVHLIAEALCKIYNKNNKKIIVGRDGRLSSLALSKSLINGFLKSGKDVIDIGVVPTPIMYFAVNFFKLTSGIIVTGSHNPKNYNGLKIIMDGHSLAGEEIQNIYKHIVSNKFLKSKNLGTLENLKINDKYIERICGDIKIKKKLKIAIDAGNGVAGPQALNVYKNLGCDVINLYCDIDGNFPNHPPNPNDPKNLNDLIEIVISNKCDLGIAFDGDGDRCIIIDNLGNILWPDRQMMLYSSDVLSRNKNSKIVFDVKSTKLLPDYIKKNNGIPVMCRTGHSFIKKKMKEIDAILGGEMSGHIFFKERWYGFDDGIYTGARMLEIISNQNLSSSELFSSLPSLCSTHELNIFVNKDGAQHDFMKKFVNNAKFSNATMSKIDGLRVDYENGWGLIRASNTMPCLVMRFEAKTETELYRIQEKFREEISKIDSTLEIPNGKE